MSYCRGIQSSAMSYISALQCPAFIFSQHSILRGSCPSIVMVRTRGGSHLRPRVRFSTPEREAPTPAPVPAPVSSPVPEAVPEEPQGFRRYQTWMGPQAPSPVPQRRSRRARPSKRARTSGPGESSSSRPQPSPVTSATEATSLPASKIRRSLFVGNPIPGNVLLHRREFHQESYYDVPVLTADPRFRDSMRLIVDYSLLPFMTPRQYYYPRVVLQFYHSMTSRGATGPLELQFSIDDRPGVLRAADISAALGLHIPTTNA